MLHTDDTGNVSNVLLGSVKERDTKGVEGGRLPIPNAAGLASSGLHDTFFTERLAASSVLESACLLARSVDSSNIQVEWCCADRKMYSQGAQECQVSD